METAFIIALAFLPVLVLLLYIRHKDRMHPEPIRKLLQAFVFGCISVLVSLCMSIPLGYLGFYPAEATSVGDSVRHAFFAAAIPEELAKLFMLWLLLRKCKHFDEHVDGIVYAVFVSLGFAAPENLMYLAGDDDYLATGIARAFFSIPGHCCFGILMGYYYSRLVFSPSRRGRNCLLLVAAPIVAHGVYDAMLFMQEQVPDMVAGLLFLLFIIFCLFMWKHCHRKIEQHLHMDELFLAQPPPLPWHHFKQPPTPQTKIQPEQARPFPPPIPPLPKE